ncbi:MAG: hypothetical protein DRJ66_03100 [Thermoprotei archaeon]|nr:MAG: hypothetical protein DRJ66_03100 [Thermoprotei archaeon]RLF19815.1 MAG: hypothetical protein DRZ82_04275 [Thermoprotei archaeon]
MTKIPCEEQKDIPLDTTHIDFDVVQISEGSRHYEPVLGSGSGSRTYLALYDRSFSSNSSCQTLVKYKRLNILNKMKSPIERKEDDIIMIIRRVTSSLNLSKNARERAINLFLKCARAIANSDRRELITLAAACVIVAIRELGHTAPVTLQEVINTFNANGARVNPMKMLWRLKELETRLGYKIPLRSCKDYVWRFVQELLKDEAIQSKLRSYNVNPEIYKHKLALLALHLLRNAENKRGGRRPSIVALAAIYAADRILAFRENHKPILTQRYIAKVAKISESTLREHYSLLFKSIVIKETYLAMLSKYNITS